ncbi:DUF3152 domain-containing protein [Streptomyces sp. TRM68367]|uniref:DUF3152 domain-containing protein n=1 Tax=Streptomyces sp. TRM68367 TaxID=2758415 RepID=UPI00165A8E77|nr:DUF3152 domain-containing protein [Streptomyces sp. TRM68367]MBC9726386.1 DUF3152 domain-containing protein [Streptomyces sp. TRM68367]
MGRHSRRGPAPKGDAVDTTARRDGLRPGQGQGQGQNAGPGAGQGGRPGPGAVPGARGPAGPGPGGPGGPGASGPGGPGAWPARGPRPMPPAGGAGPPGYGGPRLPDGTPAHGFPRLADGPPAGGGPRMPDGTPARGVPRMPDGTPAHGFPRLADGTPARGVPRVRGGHPEQREHDGGWGELGGGYGTPAEAGPAPVPRQRQAPQAGPRQDYLDAFDSGDFGRGEDDDAFARRGSASADPYASATDLHSREAGPDTSDDDAPPTGPTAQAKGAKGRTFTGIAAAAVTTVLAVTVAGQVTDQRDGGDLQSQSATDPDLDARDSATRGDGRPAPSGAPGATMLTYDQKMDQKYEVSATLKASGKFDAIPGIDRAPGTGQKYTYRVDVEQGLGLDGELFAQAVQKTLNDDRSWAHNGARAFERIYSGEPDFVITLASPGTTAVWCAKSGLDTTEDNVSCDSAATQRVMINAYRWAQGAKTYGNQIHAYRQMLINHEIGHRLGYGHVTCDKDGDLAPVMQQQTKFLDHDGIHCLPNAWPYPKS